MITEIGNKQELLSFTEEISETKPLVVQIPDVEEGDMTFTFKLCSDNTEINSYTQLNIEDDFHADVLICNAAADKDVSPIKFIQAGTYMKNYYLFFVYVLSKVGDEGLRKLHVEFYKQLI